MTMAEQYLQLADSRWDDDKDFNEQHAAMVAFRAANKAAKRPANFDKNNTYFRDGSFASGADNVCGMWK